MLICAVFLLLSLTMRSSQNLRNEEVQGLHKSSPRNPRVIVLTPTAELASQVCHLFNNVSHVFYA
jgi:predicted secreted protein